jgi:acyl dehydratase
VATRLTPEAEAWAAQEFPVHHVTVTARDIARFAHATGETDPMHFDAEAARAAGYADVVAPPMFYLLLRVEPSHLRPRSELGADGSAGQDLPPIPFTGAMAGETTVELHRPFVAGDTIACHKRVTGISEKQGRSGLLVFLHFEHRFVDERGGEVAVERFTRILR